MTDLIILSRGLAESNYVAIHTNTSIRGRDYGLSLTTEMICNFIDSDRVYSLFPQSKQSKDQVIDPL